MCGEVSGWIISRAQTSGSSDTALALHGHAFGDNFRIKYKTENWTTYKLEYIVQIFYIVILLLELKLWKISCGHGSFSKVEIENLTFREYEFRSRPSDRIGQMTAEVWLNRNSYSRKVKFSVFTMPKEPWSPNVSQYFFKVLVLISQF